MNTSNFIPNAILSVFALLTLTLLGVVTFTAVKQSFYSSKPDTGYVDVFVLTVDNNFKTLMVSSDVKLCNPLDDIIQVSGTFVNHRHVK